MDKQYIFNLLDQLDGYVYELSKIIEKDNEYIFWITELIKQIKGELEK